ncbi:MAG TPA: peptide ABC transporter substrate-binding protein, partial [Gemmatimonadales bacterium]|nr:peptide ABC transporter substrate-binding protein [Gemmatimonadales bacterium]
MIPRGLLVPLLLLGLSSGARARQRPADHGSIVVALGGEPSTPIPTLLGQKANDDVATLLFLRLAHPGVGRSLTDERGYEPQLARSWSRRDSLTLVFELDPRARWHDGVPVTANDIVWSFERMRDPAVDPDRALLLRNLSTVTAETDHRVVIRFRRAYPEQFYDATWQVQPLPAHLVDTIPPARFAGSAFVQNPVGNGPYRWARREPGRQLELSGDPAFFLGAPRIDRVVFLFARDADARMNLLLDGTVDVYEGFPQVSGPPRLAGNPAYRIEEIPSFDVVYLLFNQRAYGDRSRPHPILSDAEVRRALAMGLNRAPLLQSTYGAHVLPADAPVSGAHWTRPEVPRGIPYDPSGARALLDKRGWIDHDGDGIRDKDGVPLSLRLNLYASSASRVIMAPQIQEQLRRLGVKIEIVRLEGSVWAGRRGKGEFDIDFASSVMDPSPSGILQSWSCARRGGSNVGQYCDPAVDSLMDVAITSTR